MLLANISVAYKIYERFPNNALLRRHPSPVEERLNTLKRILENRGLSNFKFSTSKELNDSLSSICMSNAEIANAVRIMATRCMSQVRYVTKLLFKKIDI